MVDKIHNSPILPRMDKPVHIFQLGASVEEMVNMAAVAVVVAVACDCASEGVARGVLLEIRRGNRWQINQRMGAAKSKAAEELTRYRQLGEHFRGVSLLHSLYVHR